MICSVRELPPEQSRKIAQSIREDNIIVIDHEIYGASICNKKCWAIGQELSIGFLNGTSDQQDMIRQYASEWLQYANLKFAWVSSGGMIRIKFDSSDGSWAFIGTDALGVKEERTVNFGWLDAQVIRHEFGHVLGLNHSHNSKNFPYHFKKEETIKEFSGPPNNWSKEMIEYNILDKTTEYVTETTWDQDNVMNYYFPARLIEEGVDVQPSNLIGKGEQEIMRLRYPKIGNKQITPEMDILGKGPTVYDLIITEPGAYLFKISPKGFSTLIKSQRTNLIALDRGTYQLAVNGPNSAYTMTIRRIT